MSRPCSIPATSQVSAIHVLFPQTRRIKSFAQAGQQRLYAGEVRAAVRNLRMNPELRDGERVQEADELAARKSSARHVGRDDRNACPCERRFEQHMAVVRGQVRFHGHSDLTFRAPERPCWSGWSEVE